MLVDNSLEEMVRPCLSSSTWNSQKERQQLCPSLQKAQTLFASQKQPFCSDHVMGISLDSGGWKGDKGNIHHFLTLFLFFLEWVGVVDSKSILHPTGKAPYNRKCEETH
jgi:hypothetical protein